MKNIARLAIVLSIMIAILLSMSMTVAWADNETVLNPESGESLTLSDLDYIVTESCSIADLTILSGSVTIPEGVTLTITDSFLNYAIVNVYGTLDVESCSKAIIMDNGKLNIMDNGKIEGEIAEESKKVVTSKVENPLYLDTMLSGCPIYIPFAIVVIVIAVAAIIIKKKKNS